jgi:hypothetical protein
LTEVNVRCPLGRPYLDRVSDEGVNFGHPLVRRTS